MKKRLAEILADMNGDYIIAFVLWCHDRNCKVSAVAHSLWIREVRDANVHV